MPPCDKDCRAAEIAAQLAEMRGISLRDRFAALRAAHPLPAPTGHEADKAFFDDLFGDV